ncbi:MAG: acyl-CoA dehydrogenase [Hyphomicrobiaceae bacterium]|nr:MAG: acyl-CoA dehydrogenase [Hyphomicrobiaceae bacterium]
MPSYRAPLDDFRFIFNDLLRIRDYASVPGFAEATPDVIETVLREGARFVEDIVQPLNQIGDREGCRFDNGQVFAPAGFKAAFDAYRDCGWNGLTGDPAYGGQGLPRVVGIALSEMTTSACMAFGMYPGLTRGVGDVIRTHGSAEQKRTYLARLVACEWTGAMSLTEPQAGTDLGLIATKAKPAGDGTYRITGTKIFISSGDHDLAPNIIHLVLARIGGAADGAKGVSLFIVPKFLVGADGTLGMRNGAAVGSIERKMGNHGNPTCVMIYEGAVGYLIGRQHEGLHAIFTMLNATRLGSGVQGLAIAEAAYQNAARHARERLQGRSLMGTAAPDKPADPIIHQPDVRRMLMTMRSFIEGARALALWVGVLVDCAHKHPRAEEKRAADDLVSLLTPVIKAYFTDWGYQCATLAQQIFGGHGYIKESGMEQFVRDARLPMLYEGANGVQALDLVGRKLPAADGRLPKRFLGLLETFIAANRGCPAIAADFVAPLADAAEQLRIATTVICERAQRNKDDAAAASMSYLQLLALVAIGFMWTRMALVAARRLEDLPDDDEQGPLYRNKLMTGRFFMRQMLPDTMSHFAKILAATDVTMALPADAF